MPKPEYLAPKTLREALEILAIHPETTKIIAGGTDLLPRMRCGEMQPLLLLDLHKLGLDKIEANSGWLHIGATTTHTAILESGLLASRYPALVQAAGMIAGPPIRNRGTLGGNLVNASPAADLAGPLLVYDACVVLASASVERVIPLVDFFTGPGQTVMKPGEVLTEVHLPETREVISSNFTKLGKRNAMAVAVASVTVRLTLNEAGMISSARIALGSVAPRPMRSIGAEAVLVGNRPGVELISAAAQVASMESSPITDIRASADYRRKMVAVLARRALLAAWQGLERSNR
jgi:carbon-monoxide dehydrogenase medium subunit